MCFAVTCIGISFLFLFPVIVRHLLVLISNRYGRRVWPAQDSPKVTMYMMSFLCTANLAALFYTLQVMFGNKLRKMTSTICARWPLFPMCRFLPHYQRNSI